ncbi:LLM class flavin-dependent oxidoreductase [Pseudonocardia sp. KRD-184]|uniref:LLM class flavin-dependent oxidoreductase n=1 Tax=Pseudonocardia oceani TaxID=2792013 RepID=A0ABS6U1H3_9PSEU|nr:LLM class flavin-dependent oxidoreductase [Pseudonocardia oceani]MBW0089719.1 LLM class flavin-dependent oxidoreductase [Pseudonocardia oceani]MBW0096786.1 LLM class flavin-dependent oxidoreductase [Pseudonocardia oceani]MBW0109443.1 LLM class flavin-dependent oxidoreductase [Pseudonocardia oceani]MBW0120831.1 LLM class flavin-dependent oxidoreductase [Pseudonocardia oceani]MBW0126102.1 LLM class flavin-dependent oxidoreductase [Pseudonocardia oceani]
MPWGRPAARMEEYVSTLRDLGAVRHRRAAAPGGRVLPPHPEQRAAAEAGVRRQIAFSASTPAYRPVLELHGWGELADRLNRLSRQQAWAEMATAIDDDLLDAFAVSGDAAAVAAQVRERLGDVAGRLSLNTPYAADHEQVLEVTALLRGSP